MYVCVYVCSICMSSIQRETDTERCSKYINSALLYTRIVPVFHFSERSAGQANDMSFVHIYMRIPAGICDWRSRHFSATGAAMLLLEEVELSHNLSGAVNLRLLDIWTLYFNAVSSYKVPVYFVLK